MAKYNAKYQKKDRREFPFDLVPAVLTEGRPLRNPDDIPGLNWDFVPAGPAEAEQPGKTPPIEAPPVDPPPVTPPPPASGRGGGININLGGGGDTPDGSDYHPTAENLGHDGPPAGSSDYLGGAPRVLELQVPDPDEPPPPPTATGEPHRTTSPASQGPRPRPAPRLPAQPDKPISVPVEDRVRTSGKGEGQSGLQRLMNRIAFKRMQWAERNWIPLFNLDPGPVAVSLTTPYGTVQCTTSMSCDFVAIWDRMQLDLDDPKLSQKLGPAEVTVDSRGAVDINVSQGGASITCSSGTKTCQLELSPTISIGPVDVSPDMTLDGVFVTFSAGIEVAKGWSVEASQQYELSPEFTPTQAGEYILEKIGLYPIVEGLRGY